MIWEERGILFKHTDTVTEQEVTEANDRVYGDKRFIPLVHTYFEQFKGIELQGRIFETLDKAYDNE